MKFTPQQMQCLSLHIDGVNYSLDILESNDACFAQKVRSKLVRPSNVTTYNAWKMKWLVTIGFTALAQETLINEFEYIMKIMSIARCGIPVFYQSVAHINLDDAWYYYHAKVLSGIIV